jgi:IS5 family transposase
MLVTTNPQQTLCETILPAGYQDLPAELAWVDALLDDPVFFEPYRRRFSPLWGRPSTPLETYLRMMFLKHRYPLGRRCAGRSPTRSSTTPCTSGTRPTRRCWAPAVARIGSLLGRTPRAVTADRGYGEAKVAQDLTELGVNTPWSSRARASRRRPGASTSMHAAFAGWSSGVPVGGPDRLPQTPLRLRPHPARRAARRTDLVRARCARPQHRQDRPADPDPQDRHRSPDGRSRRRTSKRRAQTARRHHHTRAATGPPPSRSTAAS